MSQSAHDVSEQTVRFHRIVEMGGLEELEAALKSGANINAPGHVGTTALMLALSAKDLSRCKWHRMN